MAIKFLHRNFIQSVVCIDNLGEVLLLLPSNSCASIFRLFIVRPSYGSTYFLFPIQNYLL